ncbi:MAG: hemolysin family protein [Anaerolineaceae bacterium]
MTANTLLAVFILFLLLDLVFTAVRTSLTQARLPNLIDLREQHPAAVDRTLRLLEKPSLSASLRLALTLVRFLLAGLALLLFQALAAASTGLGVAALIMLLVALLVLMLEFILEGRILRGMRSMNGAEAWALRLSGLGAFLDGLLRPISRLLMALVGSNSQPGGSFSPVTDEDLRTWLEKEQPEGGLEKPERKMIYSIFQFGDTLCREVMVPRIDVNALDVTVSAEESIQQIIKYGHSRLPVYEDTIDNVIGVLYAKDLLRIRLGDDASTSIRKLLRPAYFVPEAKKVDELLREMQDNGMHMAIVVDEYGGMAGLVTLEDIMEEIVGEIRDEYDQSEEDLYQQISPDEFLIQGRMDLDDVNELLGTHYSKEVADTLGGFIYGEMGRVPVGGEQVSVEGWTLTVEQISGRRIRKVRARRLSPTPEAKEEEQDASER